MRLLLLVVLVAATGCPSKNTRPKTAMELCERLRPRFEGKTECAPLAKQEQLVLFDAIEGAVVLKTADGGAKDEAAWVVFTEKPSAPTAGSLLKALGGQLVTATLLQAVNVEARVSVFVERGSLGASEWEALSKSIAELKPEG